MDQALGESVALTLQNDSDREKQDLARSEERKAEFGEAMSKYSETFQINDAPASFPTH